MITYAFTKRLFLLRVVESYLCLFVTRTYYYTTLTSCMVGMRTVLIRLLVMAAHCGANHYATGAHAWPYLITRCLVLGNVLSDHDVTSLVDVFTIRWDLGIRQYIISPEYQCANQLSFHYLG